MSNPDHRQFEDERPMHCRSQSRGKPPLEAQMDQSKRPDLFSVLPSPVLGATRERIHAAERSHRATRPGHRSDMQLFYSNSLFKLMQIWLERRPHVSDLEWQSIFYPTRGRRTVVGRAGRRCKESQAHKRSSSSSPSVETRLLPHSIERRGRVSLQRIASSSAAPAISFVGVSGLSSTPTFLYASGSSHWGGRYPTLHPRPMPTWAVGWNCRCLPCIIGSRRCTLGNTRLLRGCEICII